jgi:hypothetical protein
LLSTFRGFLRRETSGPQDWVMEALLRLSPPWGHRVGADFSRGPREGWRVVEVAGRGGRVGRGHHVKFGNDDVVRKVWVAARASLVGLSGVSDGFSCAPPCRCGVEAMVKCPCGNDYRQLVACGGLGRRKPCISLSRSSSSKSELSFVGVCGQLLACGQVGRRWLPNVVVFHDDIGALIPGFGQFPSN